MHKVITCIYKAKYHSKAEYNAPMLRTVTAPGKIQAYQLLILEKILMISHRSFRVHELVAVSHESHDLFYWSCRKKASLC